MSTFTAYPWIENHQSIVTTVFKLKYRMTHFKTRENDMNPTVITVKIKFFASTHHTCHWRYTSWFSVDWTNNQCSWEKQGAQYHKRGLFTVSWIKLLVQCNILYVSIYKKYRESEVFRWIDTWDYCRQQVAISEATSSVVLAAVWWLSCCQVLIFE